MPKTDTAVTEFVNERGNTIIIYASREQGAIRIGVTGPDSESVNILTYAEARELHRALGKVI